MHKFWQNTTEEIRKHIEQNGIDQFFTSGHLGGTMIVGNGSHYIWNEYAAIMQSDRYASVIKDNTIPERCMYNIATTCNTVHHIFHIFMFEQRIGKKVSDFDTIVEIGGGYGNMARLCYDLGFRGTYYMFDLPELVEIQKYYINKYCPDLDVRWNEEKNDPDLLISTWSISEIPLEEREPYINIQPKNVMVAFSHTFEELLNLEHFNTYYTNINREIFEIPHLKGSYYMLGEK